MESTLVSALERLGKELPSLAADPLLSEKVARAFPENSRVCALRGDTDMESTLVSALERLGKELPSLAADPLLSEKVARAFPETIAMAVSKRIARTLAKRDSADAEAYPSSSRVSGCVDEADPAHGPEGGSGTESGDSPSGSLPLGFCDCDEYAPVAKEEIETSTSHWSERRLSGVEEEEKVAKANREAFRQFQERWPNGFFQEGKLELELGEKIAEGAQGEIYIHQGWVWKVFKLEDVSLFLEEQLPLGLYQDHIGVDLSRYYCWVHGARLLEDGRIAFQVWRYWGDLRRLIDLRMQDNKKAKPPFSYSVAYRLMWEIASGMRNLRDKNILHRDLKASNVFIMPSMATLAIGGVARSNHCPRHSNEFGCVVADYECSHGVVGTRFWKAPEILQALEERRMKLELFSESANVYTYAVKPELFSESSDVYSYAATCYEILTGKIPFEDLKANDCEAVCSGRVKLEWPEDIDPQIKALLEECCHLQPSKRPTFKEICERFQSMWMLFQGELTGWYSEIKNLYSLVRSVRESSRELPPDLQLLFPGLLSGLHGVYSVLQGAWSTRLGLKSTLPGSPVVSDDNSCPSDDDPRPSDGDP